LAIWGKVTPGATLTKCGLWGDMVDIITCAIFGNCRLRGVGVVRGASLPSIDLTRRPYNTGHSHTLPCDQEWCYNYDTIKHKINYINVGDNNKYSWAGIQWDRPYNTKRMYRYLRHLDNFEVDNLVRWRMHQSVCTVFSGIAWRITASISDETNIFVSLQLFLSSVYLFLSATPDVPQGTRSFPGCGRIFFGTEPVDQ